MDPVTNLWPSEKIEQNYASSFVSTSSTQSSPSYIDETLITDEVLYVRRGVFSKLKGAELFTSCRSSSIASSTVSVTVPVASTTVFITTPTSFPVKFLMEIRGFRRQITVASEHKSDRNTLDGSGFVGSSISGIIHVVPFKFNNIINRLRYSTGSINNYLYHNSNKFSNKVSYGDQRISTADHGGVRIQIRPEYTKWVFEFMFGVVVGEDIVWGYCYCNDI
ncbi:hypothetical protein PanWU01x14_300960 [Parasponia andersonii]|uniref:Uncharacterized protein n=1 Tax=Parasponia andersonii TaxID=3476 RepID=A0A2P5ATW1_PARAD|nr:hypothetical protein PanWU01x14_300960 [Parasponia andersonii]